MVIGERAVQPIVLTCEDLHWADPTTLDVVRAIAERGVAAPLFVLLTARPEFRPSWDTRSHHGMISLAPLDRHEVQQIVAGLSSRHALPKDVVDRVTERSGGVPLFIEEVTRLLLERAERGGIQAIPPTLQQSLAARLDRLGPAREVAQMGAVIGRDFSYVLLRAVAGLSDAALQAALERLAEADLLIVRGEPPHSEYRFKHVLLQDAAYESLLKSRRRALHRAIPQTLADHFKLVADAQPELLAHHLTQAGSNEQAIGFWLRAGHQAVERSANVEAMSHLSRALELIQVLPESAKRDQLELDLRTAVGAPLIAIRGYAAPEVERTYARARELSERLGGSPQFAKILWGLWVRYLSHGPVGAALEMAEQYRAVAERTQDSGHLLETCEVMGVALFYLGDFAAALPYLARGSAMYEPERHHALIYEHGGGDTGVAQRTHEGLALWTLGYPDQGGGALNMVWKLSNRFPGIRSA
jgi:predicted ATPase